MSQRTKQRPRPDLSTAAIKARAEKAAGEGRFQQALELAKQVYAGEQSQPHKELLFNAYLGRARQLRAQGQTRDAAVVLGNTLPLVEGAPAWAQQVATEYAACGQPDAALKLVEWLPDAAARGRLMAHVADAALQQGPEGRVRLPEDLRPGFDRILLAFDQSHAGQDEAARATLQEIGLQSPFLEWKLLLRGLQAYYQGDDARALENWGRLAAERLPCRLAAPLRFRMDSGFRAAQPPTTQATLQKQADELQGSALLALLRPLQAALTSDGLDRAFRLAESVLPHLRAEQPDKERRLAACFYVAVIRYGEPKHLARYRKLFGCPADDAEFHRLQALAYEHADEMETAHEHWQQYEQWVAAHPQVWGNQANRVRAMVWCRMAGNAAAEASEAGQMKMLPSPVRDMARAPTPLEPPAETCFSRSLELAPDVLETHAALVHFLRGSKEEEQAEAAARRLLERFPDHVPTLRYLGERRLLVEQPAEGLALFERAYQVNPLERDLRAWLGVAHVRLARTHLESKQFDQARAEYRTALEFFDGDKRLLPLCQWAICEMHARDVTRAEELLGQARALAGHPMAVAFAAQAEATRSKLPADGKRRFDKEYRDSLAGQLDARSAMLCLEILTAYANSKIVYRGQKTQVNQIITYLERIPKDTMVESVLERVGKALLLLAKPKVLREHAAGAGRLFPHNPWFPFMEGQSDFTDDPRKLLSKHRLPGLFERARTLAEDLPAGDERDVLLGIIDSRLQVCKAARLLSDPFAMLRMLHADGDFGIDEDDEGEW